MKTSRHGLTRCPACRAHVRAEETPGSTDCPFCGADVGTARSHTIAAAGRGGVLAASLFALSACGGNGSAVMEPVAAEPPVEPAPEVEPEAELAPETGTETLVEAEPEPAPEVEPEVEPAPAQPSPVRPRTVQRRAEETNDASDTEVQEEPSAPAAIAAYGGPPTRRLEPTRPPRVDEPRDQPLYGIPE